ADAAFVHDAPGAGPSAGGRQAARSATLTLTRRAMACDFQISLHASAEQNETPAAMAALDAIEAVEARLTVYRDSSEVADINAAAGRGPAPVSGEVFDLLRLADRLHRQTGGAYDITSGPLSEAWGFSRRRGRLPGKQELADALARVGWSRCRLDLEQQALELPSPGVQINFNSVGKGYALDCAARVLDEHGVDHCLLHGGRSTLVARGASLRGAPQEQARGAPAPCPAGWQVGVRHPLRPQVRLAECTLRDAAFSTSGSATQRFVVGGRQYGHLIDPRTGWPAEGLHSVSVVAPTGAEADALSTALYVMGLEAGEAYCRTRPEVQALFVVPGDGPGEGPSGVATRGVNLDPACWRLASVGARP
ncbi:MAG: FAD:protein FMN transferase, partial [Planctomycetota bacterium]